MTNIETWLPSTNSALKPSWCQDLVLSFTMPSCDRFLTFLGSTCYPKAPVSTYDLNTQPLIKYVSPTTWKVKKPFVSGL